MRTQAESGFGRLAQFFALTLALGQAGAAQPGFQTFVTVGRIGQHLGVGGGGAAQVTAVLQAAGQ